MKTTIKVTSKVLVHELIECLVPLEYVQCERNSNMHHRHVKINVENNKESTPLYLPTKLQRLTGGMHARYEWLSLLIDIV